MAFRDRLARLPPLPPTPAKAAAADAAQSGWKSSAARLEDLRAKMGAILARHEPRERPLPRLVLPRPDHFVELPFERREVGDRPLFERSARLSLSSRVGRVDMEGALAADSAVLSLLALDPDLAGRRVEDAVYLDTETTGLGTSSGVYPFLVGAVRREEGGFRLAQWMLHDPGDEPAMLEELRGWLDRASFVVTYNGKSFDVPLLRARYVMNRMEPPMELAHLDLLHVARRVHKTTCKSCTLGAVEGHALGFQRIGDVAGPDISSAYAHFLRTGDESALALVVEHNEQDVRSLVALVGLYAEPLRSSEGDRTGEPASLPPEDLASMALTVRRAGALEAASELAERSLRLGGGAHALRARAEIALGRGDRARALLDFEALAEQAPDDAIRLRLAKLYEHHVKAYEHALRVVASGTGERPEAAEKRRARIERKRERLSGVTPQELGAHHGDTETRRRLPARPRPKPSK